MKNIGKDFLNKGRPIRWGLPASEIGEWYCVAEKVKIYLVQDNLNPLVGLTVRAGTVEELEGKVKRRILDPTMLPPGVHSWTREE